MLARLARLPLILLLAAIGGLAMIVPAVQALALGDTRLAGLFGESAAGVLLLVTLVALAADATPVQHRVWRGHGGLASLAAGFTLLPGLLALPMALALPDTGWLNAWWEMLSCLTTTGASLYDPALLPTPLHLWRGLVGWLGGLMTLAAAVAILAPLQVGGFELVSAPLSPASQTSSGLEGKRSPRHRTGRGVPVMHPESWRMLRAGRALLPLYAGATVALWTGLAALGEGALPALMRAMGTVSTSGVSSVPGSVGARPGIAGEVLVLLVLGLALSRRFWPGGDILRTSRRLRDDPELLIAAAAVGFVAVIVLLRHAVGAVERGAATDPASLPGALGNSLAILWGAGFTALSYLTTTGWTSTDWQGAVTWSGLQEPGLILAGLAIIGGGAATAAGGVKLLRVAALARHGAHEMERIVHPAAVAGGGPTWRRLRTAGAFLAFVSFMLFAVGLAVIMLLVTLQDVEFETASVLGIAALTNTGPLMQAVAVSPALGGGAGIAGAPWEGWAGLPGPTKGVLALAMVVGRLEIVAVLALFSPGYWRR